MTPEPPEVLLQRIADLERRLEEAEETLRALRSGEVDAMVASGPGGDRAYTLRGADEAYRAIVQSMAEGAVSLAPDGLILFSNQQFASLLRTPLERVIGCRFLDFVAPRDAHIAAALLGANHGGKAEVRLAVGDGSLVPVYLSVERLVWDQAESLCVIVTDLTENQRGAEIVAGEKLARSILEQAAEAILVAAPDGRILRASRAAERLAGGPVLQQRLDELLRISLPGGAAYPFRNILADAARSGSLEDVEANGVAFDGRELELLLGAAVLCGADGEVLGCVLHLDDVTERNRRRRRLQFQADILEATSEAVIATNPEGRVTLWNAAAERLYELPREDALGHPLPGHLEYLREIPAGAQLVQNVYVRQDGASIFTGAMVNAIASENGGGIFAVIRDITERNRTEAILRDSEARERSRAAELEAIMNAVPAAVFIARDASGSHMLGNRMGYQLLRVPPGANLSQTAAPAERPEHVRYMKDGWEIASEDLPVQVAARTGQPVHASEFELKFADGSSQWWFGNAVPLLDEAGHSRGAVGAFVDITERKLSEERLRQAQKLESIGLLAGGIAHDFNNLLVGVVGNASLALDSVDPGGDTAGFLQAILQSGEQLAYLTRQMLAYAGKGRFFLERIDLSQLIPEIGSLIRPSVPRKIALHFDCAPDLPRIEADRGQLQQVLTNLVINAAEAIGSGSGLVSVKTGVQAVDDSYIRRHPQAAGLAPGAYVFLEVRDTGCGMDAATQAKIFDPFFTTKFTGRGLGLAAIGGIVRSHKGAIQVESAPQRGSCFTLLFPAAREIAQPKPAVALSAGRREGAVLVVDDEKAVRDLAAKALTMYGFEVLVANDGPQAVEILQRHPGEISLVLLDLSMPGMGGEEALPHLRRIRPEVKILVSSGYSETETMALFQGYEVSGFLQKPYAPSHLAEKIRFALK